MQPKAVTSPLKCRVANKFKGVVNMNSKLQELYNAMDNLRASLETENAKNPCDADKLIEIQKEVNATYEQIKIFQRFKTTYI